MLDFLGGTQVPPNRLLRAVPAASGVGTVLGTVAIEPTGRITLDAVGGCRSGYLVPEGIIRFLTDGTTRLTIENNGTVVMAPDQSRIVPGATSFSIRNHDNDDDNLLISDNGDITVRGDITIGGSIDLDSIRAN